MFYGFIEDTLFHLKKIVDLNNEIDSGLGYLDDNADNYFHQISRISDNRPERLNLIGVINRDNIRFTFDKNKAIDYDHIGTMSDGALNRLFNIIEYAYLVQGKTESQIDNVLSTDNNFTSYVRGSINISSKLNDIGVKVGTETVAIKVPDWIEFEVLDGEDTLKFHLWIKRAAFMKDYPFSTITKVIYSCDPQYLLNPNGFAGQIDALVKGSEFSLSAIDADVIAGDHSGILPYKTKYVVTSQSIYQMPFGVMYKGAKPSSLECRAAIRNALLGLGIANEAKWKALFPDLFVVAQFFMIPIWDNTTNRPNVVLSPSVVNHNKLYTKTVEVAPTMDPSFIVENLEIISNGQNELFTSVIPDPLNDTAYRSVRSLHPTYQAFLAENPGFAYQDDKTKEFNIRLHKCMAILLGEAEVTGDYIENTFFNRKFLSFVSSSVEYHVLKKESYVLTDV